MPTLPYETKTETESAFAASWVKQFGNIEFLILVIGSVVFFTLLLVTGNTMAISVRERTGELAILKAIGFKDGSVLFLVLAEALCHRALRGLLGLALAVLAVPVLSAALSGMLPNLILSKPMLATGIGFALVVGRLAASCPASARCACASSKRLEESEKAVHSGAQLLASDVRAVHYATSYLPLTLTTGVKYGYSYCLQLPQREGALDFRHRGSSWHCRNRWRVCRHAVAGSRIPRDAGFIGVV